MAESGSSISFIVTVNASPVEVATAIGQTITSGGNYLEDTQVVPIGPTTYRITRKYLPQWAIICGIIGLLLCLIGIIAVFFRDTEEAIVDIQPDEAGSKVVVTGMMKDSVATTIRSVLSRFPGYTPVTPAFATPTSFGIPATAPRSPDGFYWWDGAAWRLIPESQRTSPPPPPPPA